jgi:hypothetical protein
VDNLPVGGAHAASGSREHRARKRSCAGNGLLPRSDGPRNKVLSHRNPRFLVRYAGSGKKLAEALNGIDRIGDLAILTPPNFRPQVGNEGSERFGNDSSEPL